MSVSTDLGAWQSVAYENGWSDQGRPWAPVQYRRDRDCVELRGMCRGGTTGQWDATDNHVFTLPADHRPAERVELVVLAADMVGRVSIHEDGRVAVIAPTQNGWLSLDGMRFYVEGLGG